LVGKKGLQLVGHWVVWKAGSLVAKKVAQKVGYLVENLVGSRVERSAVK
jgi:hypothetical protein